MGLPTLVAGGILMAISAILMYFAWDFVNQDIFDLKKKSAMMQLVLVTGQNQFIVASMCYVSAFIVFTLYESGKAPKQF